MLYRGGCNCERGVGWCKLAAKQARYFRCLNLSPLTPSTCTTYPTACACQTACTAGRTHSANDSNLFCCRACQAYLKGLTPPQADVQGLPGAGGSRAGGSMEPGGSCRHSPREELAQDAVLEEGVEGGPVQVAMQG